MLQAADHRSAYALSALQAVASDLACLDIPAPRRRQIIGLLDVAAEAVAGEPLATVERTERRAVSARRTSRESVPVSMVGTVVPFEEFERRRLDREAAGRCLTKRPD